MSNLSNKSVCYFFAGTRLKKVITGLEESLDIKTKESEHLQSLVTKMEATPGQDEMNKVQITDLKGELAKSEETLKFRTEELLQVKKELRHSDPKFKILFRKSTISGHKIFSWIFQCQQRLNLGCLHQTKVL